MPAMTPPPSAPLPGDLPDAFSAKADALVAWLATHVTEANAFVAALNTLATTSSSSTSLTIGTGSRSLNVETGKSYLPGMTVRIVKDASNWMQGEVASYASGTGLLSVNVNYTAGSGTYASWTTQLGAPGGAGLGSNTFTGAQNWAKSTLASAASPDIWSAANLIDFTGTATVTSFPAAPQAGARRTLVCAAACSVTASANLLIDGVASGQTFTAAAGDRLEVIALTTTQFRVAIEQALPPKFGAASISASAAASALSVTLSPCTLDFRHPTLTNGAAVQRRIASDVSLTVPSGATLGGLGAVALTLAVLAIDVNGVIELAVVNTAGTTPLDDQGVITTTAISAAASSANVIYSTTARANVPYRIIGLISVTNATAGTWVAPSSVSPAIGHALAASNGAAAVVRAWVNFNSTGTLTIRASANISSVTDNGTGDFTLNFITPMPDVNYVHLSGATSDSGDAGPRHLTYKAGTKTATSLQLINETDGGTNNDTDHIGVAIIR